jgi:uncharacterized protein
VPDPIAKVDTVLLKVASRCNIDCKYCYVYHSSDQQWRNQPKRMSGEIIDAAIGRLKALKESQGQDLAVVLHGGEPLLLGLAPLRQLLVGLRRALGPASTIALQTNGTLVTDEVLDLMAETRTRLSISIDGPQGVNDRFRIDHKGSSTFAAVMEGIQRARFHPDSHHFFYGVLAVIDPESDPADVYSFFRSIDVGSVDFLFKDGNHDRLPLGKSALDTIEYGDWLARLWDIYVTDPEPIAVECLDNFVRSIYGKSATKEGSGVSNYGILIVDTDGSITKNDTLKNSYDGADRFVEHWNILDHSFETILTSAECKEYISGQLPVCNECGDCPFLTVCGGGMMLHRWSSDNGYDNPSVYCADQKYLISHIVESLRSLVA